MINPMINPQHEQENSMSRKTNTEVTEVTETESDTLSAKDLAAEFGTDPKSFRRWLRTLTSSRAGKGGRWVFDTESADSIRAAWLARSTKGTTPELEDADLD